MERACLERLTDAALRSLSREDPPPPRVLRFLLRRYLATGREDLRDGLGAALAGSFAAAASADRLDDQVDWTEVWLDVAAASPDTRVSEAAAALIARQRRQWGHAAGVAPIARSISVCLRGRVVVPADGEARLVTDAVDELERMIGLAYRPGEGIVTGGLADQIASGLALIVAFQATGRLPYAMLAEELLQFARRTRWDEERGLFNAQANEDAFVVNCDAVLFLRAAAQLHDDPDYTKAAIIAPGAAYWADAERALAALSASCDAQDLAPAACFGILMSDWTASPHP